MQCVFQIQYQQPPDTQTQAAAYQRIGDTFRKQYNGSLDGSGSGGFKTYQFFRSGTHYDGKRRSQQYAHHRADRRRGDRNHFHAVFDRFVYHRNVGGNRPRQQRSSSETSVVLLGVEQSFEFFVSEAVG